MSVGAPHATYDPGHRLANAPSPVLPPRLWTGLLPERKHPMPASSGIVGIERVPPALATFHELFDRHLTARRIADDKRVEPYACLEVAIGITLKDSHGIPRPP